MWLWGKLFDFKLVEILLLKNVVVRGFYFENRDMKRILEKFIFKLIVLLLFWKSREIIF